MCIHYSHITWAPLHHLELNCLFNILLRLMRMKTSKHYMVGPLWWGNPTVTVGFSSQGASNVEGISISWHHCVLLYFSWLASWTDEDPAIDPRLVVTGMSICLRGKLQATFLPYFRSSQQDWNFEDSIFLASLLMYSFLLNNWQW